MKLTKWQPRSTTAAPRAQVEFKRRGVVERLDAADVQDVAFETVDRVRVPKSWKHKTNYTGFYWAATTGSHVWFESLYEMAALMRVDRDPTVLAISAQPLWIHWVGGGIQRHAPDFFVRFRDGRAALVDVKPARNIKPEDVVAFDRTRGLCDSFGWEYFVVDDISEEEARNLRFLSGYRYARWSEARCVELLHAHMGKSARLSVWADLLRDVFPEPLGAAAGSERRPPRQSLGRSRRSIARSSTASVCTCGSRRPLIRTRLISSNSRRYAIFRKT